MKYTMMKRLTQMLASILFIITVLTIYLVFDFAINNAVSNKHDHGHDNIKFRTKSPVLLVSKMNKITPTSTYNHLINQERRTHSVKQKRNPVKPAPFHKSKTGIKINQVRKSAKEQRKRLSTTKNIQRKDLGTENDENHA
jgi:hypothetical protein